MQTLVSELTVDELSRIIEKAVEKKLMAILEDKDAGLKIKDSVRQRLLSQSINTKKENYGHSLEEVVQQLGL